MKTVRYVLSCLVLAMLVFTGVVIALPKKPLVHYQVEFHGFEYGHGESQTRWSLECGISSLYDFYSIFSGDDRLGWNFAPGTKCLLAVKVNGVERNVKFEAIEGQHRYILVSPDQVTVTSVLTR